MFLAAPWLVNSIFTALSNAKGRFSRAPRFGFAIQVVSVGGPMIYGYPVAELSGYPLVPHNRGDSEGKERDFGPRAKTDIDLGSLWSGMHTVPLSRILQLLDLRVFHRRTAARRCPTVHSLSSQVWAGELHLIDSTRMHLPTGSDLGAQILGCFSWCPD